jgi:tetratricopeptide (TPR) repeat protein
MRNAIAWSHDLLSEPEQLFFRRLAVFDGGFTLDAAAWVTGWQGGRVSRDETEDGRRASEGSRPETLSPHHPITPSPNSLTPRHPDTLSPQVFDLVVAISDQSLLRSLPSVAGEPRFTLLETVREYAQERLAASGEEDAARQVHAAYFVAQAEGSEARLTGSDGATELDRLQAEYDNLRAALTWTVAHDPARAVELAGALWRFWYTRGYLSEGRKWAETALATGAGTPSARAWAYHAAGDLAQEQGDYDHATPLLEAGLAAAQEAGEREVAARCLSALSFVARNRGAYEEAATFLEEALALQRELGDRRAVACSLANLGSIAQNQRQTERAEVMLAEALQTFRALGHRLLAADAATNLAILANQSGDYRRAQQLAEEALLTFRDLDDRQGIATVSVALANAERGQGHLSRAVTAYREALELFRALDHKPGVAAALNHLASVALDEGDVSQSFCLLSESLRFLLTTDNNPAQISGLSVASRVAGAAGQWELAARLIGATAALRAALGWTSSPPEEAARQQIITTIRAALGEPAFTLAEAAGQTLSPQQAVTEALRIGDGLG